MFLLSNLFHKETNMAMRSSNPALNKKTFTGFKQFESADNKTMTIEGAVNKTGVLMGCLLLTSYYAWTNPSNTILMPIGLIGGLILAITTVFKKEWSPFTAPLYALFEGLFLGGISLVFERSYPGVVTNAVMLTFGTLIALLLAYRSGIIKATENFKLGVAAATGSIFLIYALSWILRIFGVHMSFLHDSSLLSIGISVVVVVVAALNLVLDFDFIETGAKVGAPKFMEWYGAFGLMVTLVWLYLEILRLLVKLRGRD